MNHTSRSKTIETHPNGINRGCAVVLLALIAFWVWLFWLIFG